MLGELFDPKAEWFVHEHFRPHWSQAGAVVFITFRTHDSIPRAVLQRWEQEKRDWLRLRGYDVAKHWSVVLLHFDEERYRMGDFIVMPNHVHLLAAFPTAEAMKQQCGSWLHYTAFQINRAIGEKGKFWQQEPLDHLVRSAEQYERLRHYIADNPRKAGLKPGEHLYRRYDG